MTADSRWAWEEVPLPAALLDASGHALRVNAAARALPLDAPDDSGWRDQVERLGWRVALEVPGDDGLTVVTQRSPLSPREEMLVATIRQAPVAVSLKDEHGHYLAVNDVAAELLSTDVDSVTGTTVGDYDVPDARRVDDIERQVQTTGQPALLEVTVPGQAGDRTLLTLKFPVQIGDRRLVGGVAVDLTLRKSAEDALAADRDAALAASRAKDEFMSRMSHELRTPLNAILGFGQLLQLAELPSKEDRQSADHVVRAGRQLLALVDELLDLARIESGDLSLSIEPVHLLEALGTAVDAVRPIATSRGVAIDVQPVGGAVVLADRQRLQQVLVNLLDNAVRFHPGGSTTVSVEETEATWSVHVDDDGPGIPTDVRPKLFTAFEHSTSTGGSGFGLALAHGLVTAMSGTLEHRDLDGAGSRFTVCLPRATQAGEPAHDDTLGVPSAAPVVFVYIEDNVSNVHLMSRILGRWPHISLMPAIQGSVGLSLVRAHAPSLVLLDLNLPDMHGTDVLEALKADPATTNIPVIVISADATAGQRDRLLELGAFAYLSKPFVVTELVATITAALEQSTA